MRVFFLVMRNMPSEPGGGGGGVNYRLMMAQKKYKIFDDAYFIFSDNLVIDRTGEVIPLLKGDIDFKTQREVYVMLYHSFEFTTDDAFVFHDIHSFHIMHEVFSGMRNTIIVYHQQGGMYYERMAFGGESNPELEAELEALTEESIKCSDVFAFPSHGAREALMETMPVCKAWLEEKRENILYNGCTPLLYENKLPCATAKVILDFIKTFKGKVFITVAALNEAKGVERLTKFFRGLGKHSDHEWCWIIIGNGPKAKELECGIKNLNGQVLWCRDRLPNSDIMRIYAQADYYIMAHRFSIFDFATIEAMHMGCIPVLSCVGGNKEIICCDNGYLLDDDLSAEGFLEWEGNIGIPDVKKKNIEIAKNLFSEEAMIKRYFSIVVSVCG